MLTDVSKCKAAARAHHEFVAAIRLPQLHTLIRLPRYHDLFGLRHRPERIYHRSMWHGWTCF